MSSKPDFKVAALNKRDDRKNSNIGRAWKKDDGTISVVIDSFVVIHGGLDTLITLFPVEDKK